MRPGITPAINSLPTDTCAVTANRTIGILGGMIMPMVEEATVRPAAKSSG